MGQKTNPISNRIGITRGWDSNWCGENYAETNNVIKYGGIFIGGGAGHPSKTAYE